MYNGVKVMLKEVTWKAYKQIADLTVWVPKLWADGLKEDQIYPNGI